MVEKQTTELLLDHAAGTLSPSLDMLMASYAEVHPDAQASVNALHAVGGAMLEDIDGAPLSSDALDILLDRLEDGDVEPARRPNPVMDARTRSTVPAPVRRLLPASLDKLKWKSIPGGVREYSLDTGDSGKKASLLWFAPGTSVPKHTHKGREYTLILEGAYTDENGRVEAGDFVINDGSNHHQPVADANIGCLCLAVTDAPLQFSGVLGWFINPFLRH